MALDLRTPDSRLAAEAEELVRTSSPAFLANHCARSYAWSVALAEHDHVPFDAELLYVAALLHDLGLVRRFDTGSCFEEDSADAAAALAATAGWPSERREALAEAIRLHVAVARRSPPRDRRGAASRFSA
jgi:HD superfamily phosphodiesterase